ncbi:hypothetical protein OROMI_028356 [Orobanche minor]
MATVNSDSSSSSSARFSHTPYYCEENVYFLCKKLVDDGIAKSDGSDLYIPLWHQKASHRADGVILWDYHVISVQKRKESNLPHLVWDLDSSLPFPSPLPTYVAETIRPSFKLFSEFQRVFRIVHAPIFLRSFASDRRHMKDSAGNWLNPPPSYEAIVAQDGTTHNLNEYMEMSSSDVVESIGADTIETVLTQKLGVLVSDSQLDDFFSQIPDN